MRFAISFSQSRNMHLSRKISDWPMGLRFALLVLPSGLILSLAAVWLGYRAAYTPLMTSIESVPLLEAKFQASNITETFKQISCRLLAIAQLPYPNAQNMRDALATIFDNSDLVQELSFKDAAGGGVFLLRDTGNYKQLPLAEASAGPYAPFQQLAALSPQPGAVTLYPPVYFDDPSVIGQNPDARTPVLRMATDLSDGSGTLILGISIAVLRDRLIRFMRADSPLRLSSQENVHLLSFFFDARGWILFEMDSDGRKTFTPDLSREGYTGDLGRAGFDTAFRPWPEHESYWRMVTDIMEGRAGSVPMGGNRFGTAQFGGTGFLCYAPVLFAQSDGAVNLPIGGIAFFESSKLPMTAFLRLANYSLGVGVAAILLFGFTAHKVGRILARPFSQMGNTLSRMVEAGELVFLNQAAFCEEHQKFQAAVNGIVAGNISIRGDLERLSREMRQAKSRMPVDLQQALPSQEPEGEFGLVGSSALIREVRDHVRTAGKAGTDTLIWGETGTGKELVAAAIHKASARSDGPYVSINCGALDENLLLDALFGHVKGAFTEARSDRKGAFLAAEGGTLHLDEIANASFKVQQALLRALAVRRIQPLGADIEVPFNTRVVAATNVDLRECVRAGAFREDLYYRLAIISIETPPLRHRKEDIPGLAAFCIRGAAQSLGRPEARLSRGALDLMTSYDWPGNVREFKNCLTRAMAYVQGDLILRQHVTLEQDAFSTYAKPLSPLVLAERIHPGMLHDADRKPADMQSVPSPTEAPKAPYKRKSDGHAAEYLWPAPPRDAFTPARLGKPESNPDATSSVGEGEGFLSAPAAGEPLPSFSTVSSSDASLPVGFPAAASRQPRVPEVPLTVPGELPGQEKQSGLPDQAGVSAGTGDGSFQAGVQDFSSYGLASPSFENQTERRSGTPHTNRSGLPADSSTGEQREAESNTLGISLLEGLNERQMRALEYVRGQGEITRTQFEEVAGQSVSPRTLQNDLRELVKLGIFERIGAGPGTRYVGGENFPSS